MATGKPLYNRSMFIKAKGGSIIMGKGGILDRWSEYIKALFEDERGSKPVIKKNFEGPSILRAEVQKTINIMKRGKAVDPNNISIEMIESLEDLGIDMVTLLLYEVLLKILTLRITNKLRPEIAEEQNGFVEDKGTRNPIFCLSALVERSSPKKPLLKSAFRKMYPLLTNKDISWKQNHV